MIFAKFLLLDVALIALGIFCFTIFEGDKFKPYTLFGFNKDNSLDDLHVTIPDINALLEFESFARKEGSGIEPDALIGTWKFLYVFKKGTDHEDSFSSFLLRLFSASLTISRNHKNSEASEFVLSNSIEFGELAIIFKGFGDLQGKQPLLPFFFECIELKLGKRVLLRRDLDKPEKNKRPFFALIAIDDSREWMSARGRGGGLALWLQEK